MVNNEELMMNIEELDKLLSKLNYRGYTAYKRLRNLTINYEVARATFTKVQSDPHAPPSIMEIVVPSSSHKFPNDFFKSESLVPFTDYLARKLYNVTSKVRRKCGTGYSCYVGIPKPGPWILKRSSVEVRDGNDLIVRIYVGLPARGRRVLGDKAKTLLLEDVPKIIRSIISLGERKREIREHIDNYLDQEYIRKWLYENNYAFFIGDNSVLPRESSLTERPMRNSVPFRSPNSLRVSVKLPSGRLITGMAMPVGLVTVTGGGYHGKTTLLEAIQEGIYDHIEGDGREFTVSRRYTVLVKAEDGRIVSHVDISSFIDKLPSGEDTSDYTSLDSSGSTSMAASINEAIEAGAEVLLIDEDTSATNLLYKDEVMKEIVVNDPIKPFCLQARSLVSKTGVSVIAIVSASSAFINISDRIILMEKYIPRDITPNVERSNICGDELLYKTPKKRSFHGIKDLKRVKAKGFKIVAEYYRGDSYELDLTYYPRIVEKGQVKFSAYIIEKLSNLRRPMSISELISYVNRSIRDKSFSAFVKPVPPDLTVVDGFDVVWILNRLYGSTFSQIPN